MMCLFLFAALAVRLRVEDLPEALRPGLERVLAEADARSEQRLREGEWDHCIYYVLQSARFTRLPHIEPALSAQEFAASKKTPAAVEARVDAFLKAAAADDRGRYCKSLGSDRKQWLAEYARAMRFLYEKEFASRTREGAARREFVSSLYQDRGHSTDTSLDASFTLHIAVSVLHAMFPQTRVTRVLVIGPGLDFAPRTGFRDRDPVQSPQPLVLADSLLRAGLGQGALSVDVVDINPRVIRYFEKPPALKLRWNSEDEDQREFYSGLEARVRSPGTAVHARRLNILTERLDGEPYDLAVATNVLLYASDQELLLALANIRRMLKPGGFFIHNDLRNVVERYSQALGMPPVHARMIRLSERRQLYDSFVLHRVSR